MGHGEKDRYQGEMFGLNLIELLSSHFHILGCSRFFKGQPLQQDKTLLSPHASSHLTGSANFILSDFRSTEIRILKNITLLFIKFNGIFIEFTLKI